MTIWKRKLLTGDALVKEAERLGVSVMPAGELTALYEPELQQRVLTARSAGRDAILNVAQTVGIIGAFALALILARWNHRLDITEQRAASRRESADLILKFDERLNSGESGHVMKALKEHGNLNEIGMSGKALDDALDEFLGNYELLDMAYQNGLVDEYMAEGAFSYDLEKALRDGKIRGYLADSRSEKSNLYDGILELAQAWKITFDPIRIEPKEMSTPTR